jgi:hypothetical protein
LPLESVDWAGVEIAPVKRTATKHPARRRTNFVRESIE